MPHKKRIFKINFGFFIKLLIFLTVIYFFRPWFHGFFMFFYRYPIFIELVVLWIILNKFLLRKKKKRDKEVGVTTISAPDIVKFSFSFILLFAFMMGGSLFSSIIAPVHVVNELNYNSINELPETNENIRLMPFDVAYRYSKDSLQLSQFKLGTGNIAMIDDSLSWMFPLVPDGAVIQFTLKNKGIVHVDATTQEKTSNMVWKDLNTGEGMLVFDNLDWNIYKSKYFIDTDYPYYLPYEDDIYTVVSVISYSFHQKFGLLYTVPRFGGVFLINSGGEMEFLNPEEASNNEILKENRIFPENLARFYIGSYVYNKGIINRFFIHKDQIDIQDVSGTNKQPFLMYTSDGLKWFISTEPYGESHGVFKIFLVDAVSGKIDMYELPLDETLTGPIKARDFVRKSNPLVDWNRFRMIEPLPFITNNILYWKVVVIPGDAAGIAYHAFVDARTNDVFELHTDKEVEEFIKTGVKVIETPEEESKEEIVSEIRERLEEIEGLVERL